MRRSVAGLMLMVVFVVVGHAPAKRTAPKPVTPIAYQGVIYSAPNQDGRTAYVMASDRAGKELFRIKVFDVRIDPRLEEDDQWVFITELSLRGDALLVGDEKGRCFAINLTTHEVKRK